MYGYADKDYQFVISNYNGEFRASWKSTKSLTEPAIYVDGNPFNSLQKAEAACRRTLKALRNKN